MGWKEILDDLLAREEEELLNEATQEVVQELFPKEEKVINEKGLLFIEPRGPKSDKPVVDNLTKRMAAALQRADRGTWRPATGGFMRASWRGIHLCTGAYCGEESASQDFQLQDGQVTNSLCVHYLMWHRDEVPESELEKVRQLPNEEAEPPDEGMLRYHNDRSIR